MKATNKQEFFELLGNELNRIGIEDTKDIFADFEEHFTDGAMQGIPEDVTAERLGDIKEIARSYLNLESSRINSIMARDVERRRVSLTKPGRGVPADLSLIGNGSARDVANSDNIREYTPEHLSSEIYPQSSNSNVYGNGGNTANGAAGIGSTNTGNAANMGNAANSGTYSGAYSTYNQNNTNNTNNAGGSGEKTVADAFSDAGRAALDAAKITGQAVADAFKQSGVKEAVIGAGKTAADAVKAAGQTAADAVRSAGQTAAEAMQFKKQRGKKKKRGAAYNGAVPQPSDTYRDNMNTTGNAAGSRTAEIPQQNTKAKSGGYKIISISELKPNLNIGKLILAIVLDCILWSWVLPAVIGITFGGVLRGAIYSVGEGVVTIFGGNVHGLHYVFISRFFLGFGYIWLGIAAVCVAYFFVLLIIKLVKFIINLHIKAIYDL